MFCHASLPWVPPARAAQRQLSVPRSHRLRTHTIARLEAPITQIHLISEDRAGLYRSARALSSLNVKLFGHGRQFLGELLAFDED
jgi:hypothetical protein